MTSSRLLIAVAENCTFAVLQHILTEACALFTGIFTQLALHLTQQSMTTVLTRCKSTDRKVLLFAPFVALFVIFLLGGVDGIDTLQLES